MSTFSADWTTIAAMLECHAERFGSRPALLGEGGLQLSHQEMHAPMATLSLELPLSLLFRLRDAGAAGARLDELLASREIDLLEIQEEL